tara:strand:+ start:9971 stop:10228 length:258 start_codon:yes stop_codon:yes gene_type:complete
MRIKYDFVEIEILQPERRFNSNSNRKKVAELLKEESNKNISNLLLKSKEKYDLDKGTVLGVISKMKQCGFIKLTGTSKETEETQE